MESASERPLDRRFAVPKIVADPHIWILACVPLYILFVSSNWIFSPLQSIDPWVYHGFFRNLEEYKAVFPDTYYGSRLSWILPGYVVYKLLPPMAANYVLHLGLWYAAAFALYYTLKTTAGRQTALITAVFLGSYIHFLQPLGSDYVDGPANVYLLLCLAFLTAAAVGKRNALALAGAAYAAVVYTNLFTIVFAPVVALYFALLWYQYQRLHPAEHRDNQDGLSPVLSPGDSFQSAARQGTSPRAADQAGDRSTLGRTLRVGLSSIIWFVAGFAALTVLLSVVNFFIEGRFWFYMPSVHYLLAHAGQPNPWKQPLAQWINQAEWLLLPLVAAVSALIALASRRFRASLTGPAAAAAFLLAVLLMVLCEWRGIPVLQYHYYASYLIPVTFLLVGALLERPLQRLGARAAILLACGVLLITTVPLWGQHAFLGQWKSYNWPLIPLFLGAVFGTSAMLPGRITGWFTAAALAGCVVTSVPAQYAFPHRHLVHDRFARVMQAADTIDAVRNGEFIWFWYSKGDPYFDEYHALNSIYLWGYTMFGDKFPGRLSTAPIVDRALVVVPSAARDVLPTIQGVVHSSLFTAEPVDHRQIGGGEHSYSLWFARLRFDSSRLEPVALQPCAAGDCEMLVSAPKAPPARLPLESWAASTSPQCRLEALSQGLSLTTALSRVGFAAKYGPLTVETAGRYIFKLQYRLSKGGIAFGAQPADQSRWLSRASIPVSQPGERTAVLSLDIEAGEPFWLMIANDHPLGDHASQCTILELEAGRLPASEAIAIQPSHSIKQ